MSAAIRAKASHNLRVSEGVALNAPRVKWLE
ncbi:histidine kinase [Salmonella enterica subsp. enterica serovar Poona]|uniref:Histidine kinase n=1 Tax=Salmonella enterica subsp. enterica serovar Poona TaxID=436295 RepID=A0A659S090_SALET|nr:histidine kinase [Salmonella enterica subsp. enterica serovar Poona]